MEFDLETLQIALLSFKLLFDSNDTLFMNVRRVLCEYIGPHMLLIPLCRTQNGVNSLERKRADKSIDPTFGLRGVARFPIKNKYSALALTDVQ